MIRADPLKNNAKGVDTATFSDIDENARPPGDVTVTVEYSTKNDKDGLCLSAILQVAAQGPVVVDVNA